MANTIKPSKGLEKILQRDLLMPSIEEAALLTPGQLKQRLQEVSDLLKDTPSV